MGREGRSVVGMRDREGRSVVGVRDRAGGEECGGGGGVKLT